MVRNKINDELAVGFETPRFEQLARRGASQAEIEKAFGDLIESKISAGVEKLQKGRNLNREITEINGNNIRIAKLINTALENGWIYGKTANEVVRSFNDAMDMQRSRAAKEDLGTGYRDVPPEEVRAYSPKIVEYAKETDKYARERIAKEHLHKEHVNPHHTSDEFAKHLDDEWQLLNRMVQSKESGGGEPALAPARGLGAKALEMGAAAAAAASNVKTISEDELKPLIHEMSEAEKASVEEYKKFKERIALYVKGAKQVEPILARKWGFAPEEIARLSSFDSDSGVKAGTENADAEMKAFANALDELDLKASFDSISARRKELYFKLTSLSNRETPLMRIAYGSMERETNIKRELEQLSSKFINATGNPIDKLSVKAGAKLGIKDVESQETTVIRMLTGTNPADLTADVAARQQCLVELAKLDNAEKIMHETAKNPNEVLNAVHNAAVYLASGSADNVGLNSK